MKQIIKIFINDIKRICKRPIAAAILLGLLVIPGIYAWLNIDSNWDPYANTGKLPIAIVNKDKGDVILGDEINMGNEVVKSLKDNKDMKWVFTDEKSAKEKLEKSDYYGEIVIPENFSTKLITIFNTKKIERPQFDFYVNHKKNPIAPIIVNKAVSAIQNAINQNIINAIIYKSLHTADDLGLITKAASTTEELIEKLNKAKSGISDLRAILKTITTTADLTCNSLDAFRELLPTVDDISGTTQDGLSDIQNALTSFRDLSDDVDDAISSIKNDADEITDMIDTLNEEHEENIENISENISGKMDDISNKLKEKSDRINRTKDILSRVGQNLNLPHFKSLQDKLQKISDNIDDAQKTIEDTKNNAKEARENIKSIKNKLKAIRDEEVESYRTYRNSIKADLDSAYTNASKSMNSIDKLMSGLSKANKKTDKALNSMKGAINDSKDLTNNVDVILDKLILEIDKIINLISGEKESEMYDKLMSGLSKANKKTDKALNSMKGAINDSKDLTNNVDVILDKLILEIDKIINLISGEKESEMYDKFVNLLEKDPVEVANFLTTPVKTNEIDLYNINTYGSKMAPFYTVLASWVGCTLLISILKTDIDETTMETTKLKNYQKFFGRFMLFGIMAMTQGLVIGTGDILLKVQVISIPLFLLGISVASFVFMLFIFSMTISFGKVGEAFTIVVMVLQVAGSGGTYPIELLPRAFAVLQPIMPFYPAMNVLRETIGGFYKNYYLYYMCMLLAHTIIPLLLGLLFRTPIIHLKQKVDHELEKTNIII